jgi:predicted peptidase
LQQKFAGGVIICGSFPAAKFFGVKRMLKMRLAVLGGLVVMGLVSAQAFARRAAPLPGGAPVPAQVPPKVAPESAKALEQYQGLTYEDKDGKKLLYRLHVPAGFEKADAKEKLPLVVMLHGSGGWGQDNVGQISDGGSSGMRNIVSEEVQKKHPCFVIAGQLPPKLQWVEIDTKKPTHTMPKEPAETTRLTMEVVAELLKKYPIDTKRIYLTGVSLGGFGTWDMVARYPDMWAAAAPVCGGADEKTAPAVVKSGIPIWVFHGDKDSAVPVERSRNMVAAIKEAGGSVKYSEFAGVGHDSWTKAYGGMEIWDWMFEQKRK